MTGCFSCLRRFGRDVAGSAAVETVLIMPVAILVMVAAMEAGNYLYSEHQVTKAVRDAARYAARALPLGICSAESPEADVPTPGTSGSVWSNAANVAVYGSVATGTAKRLWTWTTATTDISIRYSCVTPPCGSTESCGIYESTRFAPKVVVVGKPAYPSLFGTMVGLTNSYRLYARQEAAGVGI